jgi:hypothetical protein
LELSDLLFGGTYYWHVKAYDGDNASGWSDTWSFTVVWTVEMDKPGEGDEVYANPTISWDAITGIGGYILEVDTTYEWVFDDSGVSEDLNSTVVVSSDNLWAVGAGGTVIHNDGTGWSTVDVGTSEDLTDICFIDASNAYIVGEGGTVISYDGTTWTIVDIGTTADLFAVDFSNLDNGVVVGEAGLIYTFLSGTWSEVETGDDNDLLDVQIIGTNTAWACGMDNVVVTNSNGDWVVEEVGNKDHFAIYMADANTGWIGGQSGKIYRWNGIEWFEEGSPSSDDIFSIDFNGTTGYAACEGGTMLQFEGAWKQISSGLEDDLFGVSVNNDGGLVVGADGVVLSQVNSGFNSPYLMTIDVPADTGSWDLYNLLFAQTFYYRMKAFHGQDTSAWSGVKFMTTQSSPILSDPSNGSSTDLLVEFTWKEYEGTTNYVFQVDDDEDFAQPRSFAPNYDSIVVGDLLFGTQYYWRVAAQHSEDISEWSDVWSFTTVDGITQLTPVNDAQEVNRCPLFTWEEVAGTSGYELWVDTDETFSNPNIYNGSDPSYQCQANLEMNTTYYWKVRGISGPLFSNWSDTWSFTTESGIGIDENSLVESAMIFPNPAEGQFYINVKAKESSEFSLKLVSITGAVIMESSVKLISGDNTIPVSVAGIKTGNYSVVLSNDTEIISKRVIIK